MQSLTFYEYDTVTALSVLPIGQVAPASSDDTALRLYNTSDIYQAQAVTVTLTGDDAIQLWLSTDGDTFGPAISVGDIPPNALSPNPSVPVPPHSRPSRPDGPTRSTTAAQ
jgi:hypothetical protein